MPYWPNWRVSRISRAAWANVRTGTGPSFAAMPPKSSRVTRAVFAPRSPARRAATTPAGPAPMTMTSNMWLSLYLTGAKPAPGDAINWTTQQNIGHHGQGNGDDKSLQRIKPTVHYPLVNKIHNYGQDEHPRDRTPAFAHEVNTLRWIGKHCPKVR